MALRIVAQSPNAITIDDFNINQLSAHKQALENSTFWHKFIIGNVYGLKRNVVLKILLQYIKPVEFIPLCYTQQNYGAFFFARMCKPAVEKFCEHKLVVPNPFDATKAFKLKIILKYSSTIAVRVDVTENLLTVLKRRCKSNCLCLTNFAEDQELTDFFLLSQPKLLAFVFNVSKSLKPKAIKLCNNEIKTLDAFNILQAEGLESLDLRHNLITDLAELKYLENFNITELWLEGNPLCDLYDEYNYVQNVIKYCPKIEKLDGFRLRQNGFPSFRRNFLCNMSAYTVVDQFLEDYFPNYDAKNFKGLQNLYHENAVFSMTAEFLQNQMSSSTSYLNYYTLHSRNILKVGSSITNLHQGNSQIMKLFSILPRTEHDPYSFTVDVLHYTTRSAIIIVTGVFREIPKVERVLGFNRYFILECRDNSHIYRIANEQMHVFNALTSQQVTAFKKPGALQEAKNSVEEDQMVNTFAVITNLTKEWAKMFLEECHYNLKHAMSLFIDLYKADRVPIHGFKSFE